MALSIRSLKSLNLFALSSLRSNRCNTRAFTLVELLVVIGIMSIMIGIAVVSLPGLKGSNDINKAASDIAGTLEFARTQAMAGSTYTWVGFYEEDPTGAGNNIGQVVIAAVASNDGTNLNALISNNKLPSTSLTQLLKLTKIPNIHLAVLGLSDTATRPTYPVGSASATTYQLANSTLFSGTPQFDFPLLGTVQYTFTNIIQFNPQGDATFISTNGSPQQIFEIGLQPARGNAVVAAGNGSLNKVAIQIEGIGGKVTIYRK